MGIEDSNKLYIENISLDNFKEYIENDLIEKLSQRGILFLNDKYKYSKGIKIPGLDKVIKKTIDPPDFGDRFRGGSIKTNENEIQCHLSAYKKFGILGNIIDMILDKGNQDEYRINLLMIAHKTNTKNNEIEIVLGPDNILAKTMNKLRYKLYGFFIVVLAITTVLFPPILIILVLAIILCIILLPLIVLAGIRENRIIKNGTNQLIEFITEVIESDFK